MNVLSDARPPTRYTKGNVSASGGMMEIRAGTVIASKYRLEAPIAQGGMGSVWSAHHILLDTRLAIKFINAPVASSAEARKRFEREAKAAASIQSTHVVQIHDYGIDGDVPYLVMELLEGEHLGERLARRGTLSLSETSKIVSQLARALRRAAAANIVHRDLKPSNIFVVHPDTDEEVIKILDFGVAKISHGGADDMTRTGAMLGSPRYMSPEQVRGSRLVDHRSDLWSLAVIAYRALTGQLPFNGGDVADLAVLICSESPLPPSRIDPELGPEIDAFFAKALSRAPDDRYQTAHELATALAAAGGEPAPPSVTSTNLPIVAVSPPQPCPPPVSVPRPVAAATHEEIERTRPSYQPKSSDAPPVASARRELVTAPEPFAVPGVVHELRPSLDAQRATAPEPFVVRHRAAHDPALTGSLASINVPPPTEVRPERHHQGALAILGALAAVAVLIGVWLVYVLSRSPASAATPMPVAPAQAAPTESAAAPPRAEPAVPADPVASVEPTAAPKASVAPPSPAGRATDAPPPRYRRKKPPGRSRKKNPILGI